MADLQISALPALGEAGIQATDVLALADLSATETKKVTVKDLVAAAVALLDSGDIPAAKVATPFATDAVATATIQNLAVTAAKIANGTITATQIADATITGAKLVNDTVTATQIAANAITDSELADNAVDTDAIANLAVNNAKIANTTISYGKLNLGDGDIPGSKLTSASVTATQLATNSVTATELADNAVDTAAVANAAITGAKIASTTVAAGNIVNNTITGTQIANAAIDTAQLADGAVTAAKLSGTLAATSIADDAVTTAKILDDAVTSAKLAANAVDAAALADNAVDSGAIGSNAVIEAKIAANAVTNAKIADGTITAAKLNTSNLDRSLNVASGNLGINNVITAGTRSGITFNAQGLITSTAALGASDLPIATSSAVGGVSVGTGLSVSGAGALSLTNSVTGATVNGITFNNQGMITAATALTAANLPVATTSAKGAVQITSGGGLTVDGSGNLTTSTSGISAGTYQSITVNNKGVATAGAALTAALIPDLAASKITSGSFDAARIANDSIDGTKLSNASTAVFQSIAQSGYPTAQFSGQILFDTVSEDAFIWDGNAWQAITTLTKGSLVFGGTYNATTSQMVATTSAGIAAGLSVGSNLPTASATTDGVYVVVATGGTPSSPAPAIAFAPPDYILGVTNSAGSSWNEVDLSQTVAGQVASNITFTPYGQISSTNVQDAIQELETEKLALSGGTITGQVLIGNTGSLVFEGSTIDAYETTITVADPTSSDKTITFPDTTGTVITTGDTGTVTSTMLANGTIVNADINASAAIALTKLENVTSAQIIVGNGSNVPTAVAVTGDIGINNAGLTSITAGAIVNADINASAAIAGSKITTGTTSAVGVLQLTDSATSTSATTAATPAAVKIAKDAADAAATTANAAVEKAGDTMTGNLIIDNGKELRLSEADSDGAHFTGLKAQAQTGDITLTLPAVAPTAGQVLKANASTPTTLEWGSDSATDSTKMPLAGGTFTGDVTFTGDSSNGLWDKSASAFVADLTGTASVATSITVADESTDTTCNILFATGATGNLAPKSGTNLVFNSTGNGELTTGTFVGALTGDVTGNVSGSAATVTGAAQSAITSLGTLTGLTVSGDLSLPGANYDLTWDKSANTLLFNDNTSAKFGTDGDLKIHYDGSDAYFESASANLQFRVASGNRLTINGSTGDIQLQGASGKNVSWDNSAASLIFNDNAKAIFGTSSDGVEIYHDSSHSYINNTGTGNLYIVNDNGGTINLQTNGAENAVKCIENGAVELYFNDERKFATEADGIIVQAANNANAQIQIWADNGDDDADKWRFIADTSGPISLQSKATGNWVSGFTVDTSSNATFAGTVETAGSLRAKKAGAAYCEVGSTDASGAYLILDGDSNGDASGGDYAYIGHTTAGDLEIAVDNPAGTGSVVLKSNGASYSAVNCFNTGVVELRYQNTARLQTSSAGVTVTGAVSDSKGNLRDIPVNGQSSQVTLATSDIGKVVATTSGGWVIPNSTFSNGNTITLLNDSSSDQTINASALGGALYNTADGSDIKSSTITLGARTMATIWFGSGTIAYIQAANMTVS